MWFAVLNIIDPDLITTKQKFNFLSNVRACFCSVCITCSAMFRPLMTPTPIVRLSTQTIYNLGDAIIQRLFNKRCDGNPIRYNTEDIITLLNYVSNNNTHIPDDVQIPWGDAIITLSSPKDTLQEMCIRCTLSQQHNKLAIVSSLIVQDGSTISKNEKLLKTLIPHKSRKSGNEFIGDCKLLTNNFDKDISNVLSEHIEYKQKRLVYIKLIYPKITFFIYCIWCVYCILHFEHLMHCNGNRYCHSIEFW